MSSTVKGLVILGVAFGAGYYVGRRRKMAGR